MIRVTLGFLTVDEIDLGTRTKRRIREIERKDEIFLFNN